MKTTRREFLATAGRYAIGLSGLSAMTPLLNGCAQMGDITAVGASIAASTGVISRDQAQSITRAGHAVAKTFEDITPEQEYYIGRTVGAMILKSYAPYPDPNANRYVTVLGKTLALASDMPETFGGYHFQILDSGDINALSAPGGLIFITRGLMRCCSHEDALAAVLAHEIGHVQFKHGLKAINTSRITNALVIIGTESAKNLAGKELAELTSIFEDSISDITQTLINSGYSRSLEYDADRAAVDIMRRVGYDPNGLVDMLREMSVRLKPGGLDFAKTHPEPSARISEAEEVVGAYASVKKPKGRQSRFEKGLRGV